MYPPTCLTTDEPTRGESLPEVCGNGLVGGDEQCDCGSRDCSLIDPCCDGRTCRFVAGAVCSSNGPSSSPCCHNCRFIPASSKVTVFFAFWLWLLSVKRTGGWAEYEKFCFTSCALNQLLTLTNLVTKVVCRDSDSSSCQLPQYCDGSSATCPAEKVLFSTNTPVIHHFTLPTTPLI